MYKNLKNTDLNIFPIVLGSDYYGDAISEETAFKNMDLYIENGGNIVDTARLYVSGKSEEIIGRYIRSRGLKNKLIISTKAAHPPGYRDRGPESAPPPHPLPETWRPRFACPRHHAWQHCQGYSKKPGAVA